MLSILHSDLNLRNLESIKVSLAFGYSVKFTWDKTSIKKHPIKINFEEGIETTQSNFNSNNKIMFRYLLMTPSKNYNLFLMELIFKCLPITLLEDCFSFLLAHFSLIKLSLRFKSQFSYLSNLLKSYWYVARNCSLAIFYINDSSARNPSKNAVFENSS